jgi:hypothetical protein
MRRPEDGADVRRNVQETVLYRDMFSRCIMGCCEEGNKGLPCNSTVQHDGQSTYKRNIEARSRNHCFRRKAIRITYSECVTIALVTPACKAHALYYTVICGLSRSAIFYHIIY